MKTAIVYRSRVAVPDAVSTRYASNFTGLVQGVDIVVADDQAVRDAYSEAGGYDVRRATREDEAEAAPAKKPASKKSTKKKS